MHQLVAVLLLGVLCASGQRVPEECNSCNPEECIKPERCVAGVVKDVCECCDVCGKSEFEMCDHPEVVSDRKFGKCGDNLECRVRKDLDYTQGLEAICFCRIEGVLCGSDNTTYDSMCQLNAAIIRNNAKIDVARQGPCNSAPVIVSPPENMKNVTGSNIAILCEAKGYPIPSIEWSWTRVDGRTEVLPSDDLHISVNMRGGPEKYQITGWLQIVDIQKIHEGDYTCIAQNQFGIVQASARVNVVSNGEGRDL